MKKVETAVRWADRRDMPALAALHNRIWNENNAPHTVQLTPEAYEASHPIGSELVALADGALCGFISIGTPTRLASNAHVASLAIAVDPAFQGLGIGRKLMEAAYAAAREQGKRKLSLRVLATNEGAIAFYEKLGFRIEGRLVEEFFVAGRYVDDVLMYRLIEP